MNRLGSMVVVLTLMGMLGADDPPAREPSKPEAGKNQRRATDKNQRRMTKSRKAEPPPSVAPPSGEKPSPAPPDRHDLPGPDSVKPTPLVPIPDSPPPHEGKLFDLPIIIEPPDMLIVEVLEALPGRPLSGGDRLVRPDGTISLGFYGDVHVRGLTLPQAKEKIVLHLRRTLPDEVLQLVILDPSLDTFSPVAPRDSLAVFVDMTSYNSKHYYVQGAVTAPGELPFTGRETILDAINRARGLLPTADARNIRLHRPARAGRAAHDYRVDLEAIQKGDAEKNFQLFPGDRLIVDRDRLISATVQQDRINVPFHALTNRIREVSLMANEFATATPNMRPEDREKLIRNWAELWLRAAGNSDGPAREAAEGAFLELSLKFVRATDSKNPQKTEQRPSAPR